MSGVRARVDYQPVTSVLGLLGLSCLGFWTATLLAHQSAQSKVAIISAPNYQQIGTDRVMAELDIPSIAFKVPIFSGCSFLSLERGACHLQDSAHFGGLGNAAVAGHRDKDFRNLQSVRRGMNIVVVDQAGRHRYIVDSTEIVPPEDVKVLDIHDQPELTLITCYPFHYIGPAPQRFIVHAHLMMAPRESTDSPL